MFSAQLYLLLFGVHVASHHYHNMEKTEAVLKGLYIREITLKCDYITDRIATL